VAELLREHTSGQLDVVVVTHRHKDHLSAFGSQPIVELLADPGFPKLVVRSWTEGPAIAADATGPTPAPTDGQGASLL
jgi:glyoxylase-like metal-dependent hydrolase (beta-lactamase superfamily II)